MQRLDRVLAMMFGFSLLALALAVAVETIMRKVFNKSLQGVDELGGYILAVAAALSFAIAIHARTHIRIDLLHDRLPRDMRACSQRAGDAVDCALRSGRVYMAWIALIGYHLLQRNGADAVGDTAANIPQSAWVGALGLFADRRARSKPVAPQLCCWPGGATRWIVRYGPRGAKEELDEELADLKARGVTDAAVDGESRP